MSTPLRSLDREEMGSPAALRREVRSQLSSVRCVRIETFAWTTEQSRSLQFRIA
jgi:hypothetical protein